MMASEEKKSLVAVCSGEGSGLAVIAEACRQSVLNYKLAGIVTDGSCGAVQLGRQLGVPVKTVDFASYSSRIDFDLALKKAVLSWRPDILLLYFNKLVDASLIKAMNGRIINTHYSLLPSFPGFKAIPNALKYGCLFTGVTLHCVDEGVDSGPILAQAVCPILAADSEQTLGKRLFEISVPLTLATLHFLPQTSVGKEPFRVADGSVCLCSLPIPDGIRSFLEARIT
jgi:phosphoribosylglycinamide formyltransferase-1